MKLYTSDSWEAFWETLKRFRARGNPRFVQIQVLRSITFLSWIYIYSNICLVDAQVFLILQKILYFAKKIISILFIFLFYKHCSLLIIFFFSSLLFFNFLLGFVCWHKLDKNWIHENSCHKWLKWRPNLNVPKVIIK